MSRLAPEAFAYREDNALPCTRISEDASWTFDYDGERDKSRGTMGMNTVHFGYQGVELPSPNS
jgi:hypothetical protein